MKRKNEYKVFLRIHHFQCEPEEITKELLINPTITWKKGDVIPNRKNEVHRKQSTWQLLSIEAPNDSVENQIQSLLNQIEPKKETLKKLTGRYFGELAIVMYLYTDFNPGITLSKEVVKRIGDLGLTVDFDIYFLSQTQ